MSYNNNRSNRFKANYIDTSDSDFAEEEEGYNPSQYCIFCNQRLSYNIYKNAWWCEQCKWEFPKEPPQGGGEEENHAQPSSQPTTTTVRPPQGGARGEPTMSGGRASGGGDGNNNNNIEYSNAAEELDALISSRHKSRNEELQERLDPEDEFDKNLKKKGYRLVRTWTHQPQGDPGTEG